nr:hypothetical protein CFP56_58722 [Quercus suber]
MSSMIHGEGSSPNIVIMHFPMTVDGAEEQQTCRPDAGSMVLSRAIFLRRAQQLEQMEDNDIDMFPSSSSQY